MEFLRIVFNEKKKLFKKKSGWNEPVLLKRMNVIFSIVFSSFTNYTELISMEYKQKTKKKCLNSIGKWNKMPFIA